MRSVLCQGWLQTVTWTIRYLLPKNELFQLSVIIADNFASTGSQPDRNTSRVKRTMPPRPPLTSLAIHAWKEHGKPRPLSNHDEAEESARARISRSISIEAQLAANRGEAAIHSASDDDLFPCANARSFSRSSTFDDNLSSQLAAPSLLPAASAACESATRSAMERSISMDDGICSQTSVARVHCTALDMRGDVPSVHASAAVTSPPHASEDEAEFVFAPVAARAGDTRVGKPSPLSVSCTSAVSEDEAVSFTRGRGGGRARRRKSHRRNLSAVPALRAAACLSRAANGEIKMEYTESASRYQTPIVEENDWKGREESLLEESTSMDTGLSAIVKGQVVAQNGVCPNV